MTLTKLNAKTRTLSSKGALNALRKGGSIPAVCYADKQEPIHISVDGHSFLSSWGIPGGRNTLFTLEIEGGTPVNAIVHEVQKDVVTDEVTHIDFMLVTEDKPVKVDVPVKLVGTPIGVKNEGGALSVRARKVRISCLPTEIPSAFEYDISSIPAKSVRFLRDIDLKGATLVSSPQTVLLAISKGRAK